MNRHILITGATRGIGRACLEAFAARGWRITALARSANDLQALRVAHPEAQLLTVSADLATTDGVASVPQAEYDVIILNAATFSPGQLLSSEQDVFSDLWALNGRGNHLLARRLLPAMIARNHGHLVVIGSLGTDYWPEHLTAYVATKYALRGLFLGWQAELARTNILTTLVAPGATLTSSWDNEEPPADILSPALVAEAVLRAVEQELTGRIKVR